MQQHPLVSIITPCYNDGLYIAQTISSVAASSYPNIEHIIVDDGSTDPYTIEVLSKIEQPHIRVIRTINGGAAKARNTAIEAAKGKYILPVDADDLISKDLIALSVQILESQPNIKVVATPFTYFGGKSGEVELEPYSLKRLLGHNFITITSMFRRADFLACSGFNPNMQLGLEDWDFWLTLLGDGGEVHYLEGCHFWYRIKERTFARNHISFLNQVRLSYQLWQNHSDLYHNTPISFKEMIPYKMWILSKIYYAARWIRQGGRN